MLGMYLSGIFTMGLAVIAFIFWRSWKEAGDRFFFHFSLGFALLALERVILALFDKMEEPGSLVYLIRLGAFLAILNALYRQNFLKKKASKEKGNVRYLKPRRAES